MIKASHNRKEVMISREENLTWSFFDENPVEWGLS
jgi:hypothetical protein